MIIRTYGPADLQQLEEIHRKFHTEDFPMPDITEAYATALVEVEGKILGFGLLRNISESIMLLDLSLPKRIKSVVLSELIKESIRNSKHDFVHSFVGDESFEKVLKNHFGYVDCKGKSLVLET
jgi:hypothetical protein